MKNPRLAKIYAKSLLDLALEQNALDPILNDIQLMQKMCHESKDFTLMLQSPIIKGDKKINILEAIFTDKLNPVTKAFVLLLVKKSRESFLPEIAESFIQQYKTYKNIHIVRLTTAAPLNEGLQQQLTEKINSSVGNGTVELETKVDEQLIGGFILEIKDKLFDASIRRDLMDIKKQFIHNEFIAKI